LTGAKELALAADFAGLLAWRGRALDGESSESREFRARIWRARGLPAAR